MVFSSTLHSGILTRKLESRLRNVIGLKNCPAGIYLFKVNDENTGTMCETYSKLTIKTPERRHQQFWCFHCWLWTSKSQLGCQKLEQEKTWKAAGKNSTFNRNHNCEDQVKFPKYFQKTQLFPIYRFLEKDTELRKYFFQSTFPFTTVKRLPH